MTGMNGSCHVAIHDNGLLQSVAKDSRCFYDVKKRTKVVELTCWRWTFTSRGLTMVEGTEQWLSPEKKRRKRRDAELLGANVWRGGTIFFTVRLFYWIICISGWIKLHEIDCVSRFHIVIIGNRFIKAIYHSSPWSRLCLSNHLVWC